MDDLETGNAGVVAEEPTGAAPEIVVTEEGTGAAQPPEAPDDEQHEQPDALRKQLNKALRKRAEARAHADKLEAELAAERAALAELRGKQATQELQGSMPDVNTFDDPTEYQKALTAWTVKTEIAKGQMVHNEAVRAEAAKTRENQFATNRDSMYAEAETRLQNGDKRFANFVEQVTSVPNLSFDLAEDIFDTDKAADIALYLANHHEEVDRLAKLHPRKRAIAVGALANRLSIKPTVRPTSAAEPIKPTKASGVQLPKKESEMSDAEFFAWKDAQRRGSG